MAKMGFGTDRIKVVQVLPGRKCSEEINGRIYHFDSQFERDWAKYLQFLLIHDEIGSWSYHPVTWSFRGFGYQKRPFVYTPDFAILDEDGIIYQECKGYIKTRDISRIRRAAKHYDVRFDLVMQRLSKKSKRSQIVAKASDYAFVRRVIDASQIFRQCKGLL